MLKSKSKLRVISLLLMIVMLIGTFNFHTITVKAAKADKKVLVLIQNKKKWVASENIVVRSPENNLMLKANTISKKLGFTYKKVDSKKFTISSGSNVLTFTKGAKDYQYKTKSSNKKYKNTYTPYTAKIDGTSYNLIPYNSLSKLLNVKYFPTKGTEYSKYGYTGVIVLSHTEKISELPKTTSVLDEKGKDFFIPTSFPTPSPTPTPKPSGDTIITIGGVDVPTVGEGFKKPSDTSNGKFGDDTDNNHPFYDSAKNFDKYIQQAMSDLGINVPADASKVIINGDTISISPYGSHSQRQSMSLTKNSGSNQYELVLKTRLKGHDQATIDNNSLKLLIAAFTNDVNTLYNAIYSHWEDNNDYGINKESFVTIGSCKVKYVSSNGQGYGTYIIKSK